MYCWVCSVPTCLGTHLDRGPLNISRSGLHRLHTLHHHSLAQGCYTPSLLFSLHPHNLLNNLTSLQNRSILHSLNLRNLLGTVVVIQEHGFVDSLNQ